MEEHEEDTVLDLQIDDGDAALASLEFQEFSTSKTAPASGLGEISAPASEREQLLEEPAPPPPASSSAPLWSLEYYQKFFDVDTEQVVNRIRLSAWPYKNAFLQSIKGRGDLYGPFWVSSTLVFVIAMAGNIVNYNELSRDDRQTWQYDFSKVSLAATTIYTYVTLIPFIVWLLLRWRTTLSLSALEILCLYGYSLFVFIPVSLLFVVLGNALRWVFISLAMVASGGVLVGNFHKMLNGQSRQVIMLVLGLVAGAHIGVAMMMKFFFFSYSH